MRPAAAATQQPRSHALRKLPPGTTAPVSNLEPCSTHGVCTLPYTRYHTVLFHFSVRDGLAFPCCSQCVSPPLSASLSWPRWGRDSTGPLDLVAWFAGSRGDAVREARGRQQGRGTGAQRARQRVAAGSQQGRRRAPAGAGPVPRGAARGGSALRSRGAAAGPLAGIGRAAREVVRHAPARDDALLGAIRVPVDCRRQVAR